MAYIFQTIFCEFQFYFEMASVNTIDKFGRRHTKKNLVIERRGPPGIGFKLDSSGHYDIQKKRLTNIGEPIQESDATTQTYVNEQIAQLTHSIENAVKESTALILSSVYNRVKNENDVIKQLLEKAQETLTTRIAKVEESLSERMNKMEVAIKSQDPHESRLALPPMWEDTSLIES